MLKCYFIVFLFKLMGYAIYVSIYFNITMTLHKIIDKICKCFRLAESTNPNEAAAALRQAVGLMQKYDISEEQVDAFEFGINQINETSVTSCATSKPAYWILALSNLVAEAFDCGVYIARKQQSKPEFVFIGADNRPEIASYLYTILYRSLGRARVDFMRGLEIQDGCRHNAKERRRRANIFAQAWLFHVSTKVHMFKNNKAVQPKSKKPVDEYVEQKYGQTLDYMCEAVKTKAPDYDDIIFGMRAAENVHLFRPLKRVDKPVLIASVI